MKGAKKMIKIFSFCVSHLFIMTALISNGIKCLADNNELKSVSEKAGEITLIKDAIDESAGNVPCFKIETPIATYLVHPEIEYNAIFLKQIEHFCVFSN